MREGAMGLRREFEDGVLRPSLGPLLLHPDWIEFTSALDGFK